MKSLPTTSAGWKLRLLFGSLALDKPGTRIGKLLSIVIIIGFSVGATFFFHGVFENLLQYEGIGEPLLWRIITITIVTVFAMLVISNLITGIATLFRSPEIPFLFARPIPAGRIFLGRFTDNLIYSSWSLAVLGVPIIIAWGWVFKLPVWIMGLLMLFGLVSIVLIAAIIGSIILLALILLARLASPRAVMLLVAIMLVGVLGWAFSQRGRGLIVGGAARASTVERYLSRLDRQSRSYMTPAHWLVVSMRSIRQKDNTRAFFLMGLLLLTAVVWMRWLYLLTDRAYYHAWTAFNELSARPNRSAPGFANRFTKGLFPNPLNAMLLKDALQFTRNPNQWAQFMILVAFLLIYLFNLLYVSRHFNFNSPYWNTMVLFLNFAFTGFILATLSVRFVFPLISLEGRGFWVVRSAPISVGKLFWEKFFLAFLIFMGLCELIVFFSNHSLNVTGTMMILTTSTTFMMGGTLMGMAIGMGALMPDFSDESPMRIASTPGGVLTVVISLVYVGLMVAILAWPTYGYFKYLTGQETFPRTQALQALAITIALNVVLFAVPLKLGRRALKSIDL